MGFREELARQAAVAREKRELARKPHPEVKTYKDAKEFQHDAEKMFAKGYTVAGQSADGNQHLTVTRVALLGPLALFAKKGGKQVTVTWMPPS